MSNISDQTTQQSKKTRLIIDEVGVDTETGIIGRGHSYDNGKTFTVDKTIYGRIFHENDYDQVWKGIQDKVTTVVEPAKSAADSAVAYANDAIKNSQVNSQAIDDINSAVSDAKQGANDALSRAVSAWDVATGAKEAVTDFDPLLKSAQSDAGKALAQIADTASALSDAKGEFNSGVAVAKNLANTTQLTADSAVAVASDAKSNATVAIQTASQASLTAINANSDATIAKQTASEAKVQASNAESDFAQLSIRAGQIEASVANNSGAIASVQQTANGLTTTVADIKANGGGRNLITGTSRDLQTAPDSEVNTDGGLIYIFNSDELSRLAGNQVTARVFIHNPTTHTVNLVMWTDGGGFGVGTDVPAGTDRYSTITAYNITSSDTAGDISIRSYTENVAISGVQYKELKLEKGTVAHDWSPAPEDLQNQFTQIKQSIDGITTTINDPKTGLNATYQTASGNATTISNVKSDVYQLQTTANGLTSRVGNLESKTNTQETAIEQNKNAIALKADQTAVDKINGTVSQLQSSLTVQAGQIQEKVTSSQVTGMLAGYATQDYTQSLVTQKANDWNLNLTNLKTDVNAIKTNGGGVNLLQGTRDFSGSNWLNLGTWTKTDETYNGLSALETTGDWGGVSQYYQVMQGETYTFSLFARYTSGTGTSSFYIGLNSDPENGYKNAQVDNGALTCSLDTNWKKCSITFTANTDGYIKPRIERTDANTNPLRVCGYMLEKGTVAHDWSPAPSDMATVTSVTNLSATVDGIQAQVYNSDGSSKITQLSNLISTKVSSDDFNKLSKTVGLQTLDSADINTMKTNGHYFVHNLANTPIQGWVYVDVVGNGNDRIRQDVYQDIGNQHCYRRWYNSSWMDWSQGATESEITQLSDDINLRVKSADLISQINLQAGTALIQSNKLVLDAGTTVFTGDAFIPSAAISSISADKITIGGTSLFSSDGTFNLINESGGTASSSLKLTTGIMEGLSQPLTQLSNGTNTHALEVGQNGINVTPTIFFNDYPDEAKDTGWVGFSRHRTNGEVIFHTYDDSKELFRVVCAARFNNDLHIDQTLWQQGLSIKNGNTIWSGSDYLAIGTNVTNTYANVMARSFSQQSTLSSKTNIETVDPKDALDLVNRTDIRSYQYKADVAQGKIKRYTSLIIDDVNDVSQYYAPDEFANEDRTGRDDGSAVGYLFLAVKELTRRIEILEDKLNG